jgi:prepilin-type N-terminal cleavage/methylation domain-containing protein
MKSLNAQRARGGFTLLELLIATMLIGVVLALTVPFFRIQVQAFGGVAGRDDAHQNAQFGISMIDRELRIAGVGVVDQQPLVIQAAPNAITFSVDLVSRSPTDASAAYYDPDVDANAVSALRPSTRITLPLSTVQYPDTTYAQNASGPPSAAETISFWVAPDPNPSAIGTHVLYRRVNDLPPTVVAKAISLLPNEPVFRYFKADPLGRLVEIQQALLPLYHSAPIHNSKADTARSALTDSIRVVRVRLTGVFTDRSGAKKTRPIETGVRIMNAGLLHFSGCGDAPIFSSIVAGVGSIVPSPNIVLTWNPSADQTAGEKDVEQYSIYRRKDTDPAFTEPLSSVPSGQPAYSFTDTQVASGDKWVYAVAAKDCGDQSSALMTSAVITVP